ncbi:MAG: flavin oxidoreductase [Bacteroidetes bacterium]|nr:MAG: flavin oxidoreductase [Bacteroidota bacterium]
MPTYSAQDLQAADRSWRINFINSLIGPKNLHVLITRSPTGLLNAAIFNSGLHIGSSPPYVGFLLRPTSVPRHTYENLLHYPYATLNAVTHAFYRQAHATHRKLPASQSELEVVGLETREVPDEDLPYLASSPLTARLHWVEEHLLTVNKTRLLIFAVEIVHVKAEPDPDGFLRLDGLDLVAGSGCDGYWTLHFMGRLPIQRSP